MKEQREDFSMVVKPRRIRVERVYQESDIERVSGKVVELKDIGLALYHYNEGQGHSLLGGCSREKERVHIFTTRDIYRGMLEPSIMVLGTLQGKLSFTPRGLVVPGIPEKTWKYMSISENDDPHVYLSLDKLLQEEGL